MGRKEDINGKKVKTRKVNFKLQHMLHALCFVLLCCFFLMKLQINETMLSLLWKQRVIKEVTVEGLAVTYRAGDLVSYGSELYSEVCWHLIR